MTTPIASEPERLVDDLMTLADACITLARGVAEAHALDEPAEEWELDQKLTAARRTLRTALESALSSRSGSAAETAGWISVDERLPPDDRSVIVWRAGRFNLADKTCRFNGEWLTPSRESAEAITHWMPLPQPPSTSTPDGNTGT